MKYALFGHTTKCGLEPYNVIKTSSWGMYAVRTKKERGKDTQVHTSMDNKKTAIYSPVISVFWGSKLKEYKVAF